MRLLLVEQTLPLLRPVAIFRHDRLLVLSSRSIASIGGATIFLRVALRRGSAVCSKLCLASLEKQIIACYSESRNTIQLRSKTIPGDGRERGGLARGSG